MSASATQGGHNNVLWKKAKQHFVNLVLYTAFFCLDGRREGSSSEHNETPDQPLPVIHFPSRRVAVCSKLAWVAG